RPASASRRSGSAPVRGATGRSSCSTTWPASRRASRGSCGATRASATRSRGWRATSRRTWSRAASPLPSTHTAADDDMPEPAADDLSRYPRDLDRDLALLAAEGVDVAFAPGAEEMYGPDETTRVRVGGLGDRLEGAHRPGHFEGVATVVTKLFEVGRPHVAYF